MPAQVSPVCGRPESNAGVCPPGYPGEEHPYNCVQIATLESEYWMLTYRLSNGSATDCFKELQLDSVANVAWPAPGSDPSVTPDCSGPPFTSEPGIESARNVEGTLYYGRGTPVMTELISQYTDSGCHVFGASADTYYPFVPVPEEVTGLLNNPPYTLTLEQ